MSNVLLIHSVLIRADTLYEAEFALASHVDKELHYRARAQTIISVIDGHFAAVKLAKGVRFFGEPDKAVEAQVKVTAASKGQLPIAKEFP
uniref:Flotillin-like n=1 Tax=Aegilops tauschii TaxID=37682 RepID=M8BR33_AEGTA